MSYNLLQQSRVRQLASTPKQSTQIRRPGMGPSSTQPAYSLALLLLQLGRVVVTTPQRVSGDSVPPQSSCSAQASAERVHTMLRPGSRMTVRFSASMVSRTALIRSAGVGSLSPLQHTHCQHESFV